MRRLAPLALAAGLLLTLGLPPFGFWPLALVGAGVLATILRQPLSTRRRALVGLLVGVGFLAPGLWWMTEFSLPGWALAMLLEAGMVTLAVVLVPPGRWKLVGFPAALVLADVMRGHWPFGGVPIATVGETQIGGPLLDAARIGGGLLVTALVGITGVALSSLVGRRPVRAIAAILLVGLVAVAGSVAPDGVRRSTLRAAIVQAGGERGTRAIDTSAAAVFEAHLAATDLVPAGVDLILWPEDVVDVEGDVLKTPEGDRLAAAAAMHGATLVAGVVEGEAKDFRNIARAWEPDGRIGPAYEKNHRVPFGEYIPFRSLVEKVADISAVPRDAHIGHGTGVLPTRAGRLGVVISFEVFFARRARDAIAHGGQVLLVPTNASSYSSTQMPALELGAARMRAIETGRDVLQAAPTGFSAVVDHRGTVRQRTNLGDREVLTATVERRAGDTLYTRLGDGPFVFLTLLALVIAWGFTIRASRRADPLRGLLRRR
ncbi:MAG: Apolipoprotein N-acyltransferase [Actinomycetia bacterium]|nr:Apolipoprotein N-acyltransferase [Actinomycetes bacterium]